MADARSYESAVLPRVVQYWGELPHEILAVLKDGLLLRTIRMERAAGQREYICQLPVVELRLLHKEWCPNETLHVWHHEALPRFAWECLGAVRLKCAVVPTCNVHHATHVPHVTREIMAVVGKV